MLRKIPFIKPMAPTLAKTPPVGADWSHEVKIDGWRMQLHIEQGEATIYSKNGADYTKRFRAFATRLRASRSSRRSSTASSSPATILDCRTSGR
jgi:ATP-dependent DNA ligase